MERGRPSISDVAAGLIPLVVFAGLAYLQVRSGRPPNFDERIFLDVADHIRRTGLPTRAYALPEPALFFDHTPLYVYFVALLGLLEADTVALARSATLLFGAGTVLLVYAVAREIRGPLAGSLAALLVAANPYFVAHSWFVRMEVPLCLFLVLAVLFLVRGQFLPAGLAIAVAVLLKEIALGFWLVAVAYAAIRHQPRDAVAVAAPSVAAFVGWLGYAALLDAGQLAATMDRWFGSATGDGTDRRLRISRLAWLGTILGVILGPLLVAAAAITAIVTVARRHAIPPIAVATASYVVLATAASFVIRLKEPRFLIAIVPMTALTIGLLVDWDGVARGLVRRRAPRESYPESASA